MQIEGYDLPEWELTKAASLSRQHSAFSLGYTARASTIASLIDRYNPQQIDLSQVIARAINFLPRHECFDLFPLPDGEGKETDVNELLIHIRLGDVKTLTHPIYGPLPISYYKYLIDKTGFRPVFMGETDDSPYCTALRVTFPYAKSLPRSSVRNDFQSIRRAHNVALSVSSFSWVAAYLSGAQRIHLPIFFLMIDVLRSTLSRIECGPRAIATTRLITRNSTPRQWRPSTSLGLSPP